VLGRPQNGTTGRQPQYGQDSRTVHHRDENHPRPASWPWPPTSTTRAASSTRATSPCTTASAPPSRSPSRPLRT